MRVGIGYDIHPLVAGQPLVLGGVEIPADRGLQGHSDADVLAHAVGDALLGAAGLGDLGKHFPPGDPVWKGVSSLVILNRIADMVRRSGYSIINLDGVVLLEEPQVAPHVERMRSNMAEALGVSAECVSVKATTAERLGPVGRGEGAAAMAVTLLEQRQEDSPGGTVAE